MKTIFLWILTAVLSSVAVGTLGGERLWAQEGPVLQPSGLSTGYIPIGYDDNDNVQVTVEGYFPDSCYKVGPTSTRVTDSTVMLQQFAYRYFGICLDMIVPFHQTVNLGILKRGTYNVVDASSGTSLGALPVAAARSSNADDFLYAPVSDAVISHGGGQWGVTITGDFTDSCLYFQNVATKVFGNVIEVLPITERAKLNNCNRGLYPFQKTAVVSKPPPGRYLLHVRSLEGQSINKVVDVR